MLTLGFYVRPWVKVDYPDIPSIGRFESNYFLPRTWKPDYPQPGVRERPARRPVLGRPHRRGASRRRHAARRADGAVFRSARHGYLVETLLERKSKVLTAWLNGTNPIVNLALSASGELTFDNAAEQAGVAKRGRALHGAVVAVRQRHRHASAVGRRADASRNAAAQAPAALLSARPEFIAARLRAFHADHPAWAQPLVVYFRRAGDGWTLVGLERNP